MLGCESLELALLYSFTISIFILVIILFPALGINIHRWYRFGWDNLGGNKVSMYTSYYRTTNRKFTIFQVVDKTKLSSILAFLRYGVIIVPAILILAPRLGIKGVYISNAMSDGISGIVAIIYIIVELIRLRRTDQTISIQK